MAEPGAYGGPSIYAGCQAEPEDDPDGGGVEAPPEEELGPFGPEGAGCAGEEPEFHRHRARRGRQHHLTIEKGEGAQKERTERRRRGEREGEDWKDGDLREDVDDGERLARGDGPEREPTPVDQDPPP